MAGIIRSKGPQTFSAQIQPVNTNTGSDLVINALQRATNRLNDSLYKESVTEQQELGRQVATKAPIRNEQGELIFEDVTADLSRVARNSARPILERNYGIAFSQDVKNALNDIRTKSKTAAEYDLKSKAALDGLLAGVPEDFAHLGKAVMENTAADIQIQHKYAMQLDEARQQDRIALENLQLMYQDNADTVASLIRGGDIGGAAAMRDAIINDLNETGTEDGLTDQNIRAIRNEVDRAYFGTLIQAESEYLLSQGNFEAVEAMAAALHSGTVINVGDLKDYKADEKMQLMDGQQTLVDIGFDQDTINQIQDPDVRQALAGDLRVSINGYAERQRAQAEGIAIARVANDVAQGLTVVGQKNEKRLDAWYSSVGIDPKQWASAETLQILQNNPQAQLILTQGGIMPFSLATELNAVATGGARTQEELERLTVIWNLTTKGIGPEGSINRSKNLTDEAHAFWANVSTFANSYGTEKMGEAARFFANDDDLTVRRSSVLANFNSPNGNPQQIIRNRIAEEKLFGKDYPPSAPNRMMNIAMNAYATFDKKKADQYIKNAYNAIYAESSTTMVRTQTGGIQTGRHEFALEQFYTEGQMTPVSRFIERKVDKASGSPNAGRLGEDFFLMPANQSTNQQATYAVMTKDGEMIMNKDGLPMTITTTQINQHAGITTNSFQQAIDAKIKRAQRVRADLINLDKTGMERDTEEGLNEAISGFEKSGIL